MKMLILNLLVLLHSLSKVNLVPPNKFPLSQRRPTVMMTALSCPMEGSSTLMCGQVKTFRRLKRPRIPTMSVGALATIRNKHL